MKRFDFVMEAVAAMIATLPVATHKEPERKLGKALSYFLEAHGLERTFQNKESSCILEVVSPDGTQIIWSRDREGKIWITRRSLVEIPNLEDCCQKNNQASLD